MYELHLTAEQIEFRDTVRDFVNDEIKPVTLNAQRLDAGDRRLPIDVLRKASQIGLRTLALPEELGGVGADGVTCCIVTEELAAGDADVAAVLAETCALGRLLFAKMTAEQRERFKAFLDDDDFHLALACREPGDDSALGINYHCAAPAMVLATKATRSGDHWIIDGAKDCVANAPIAKLIAVEAQTDQGAALFLMPPTIAGLTVAEQPEPRWYHGARGRLSLKAVRVPEANRLSGPLDSGWAAPLALALNLGIGRAATEAALEYAHLRTQGGRRLIEHQAIGSKLADCAIRLDLARTAVWRAAWAADHPEAVADRSLPDLPIAAMARVYVSEAIHRVAKDAAECFGAMGVMRDMPLQKYIHDALICLHNGDGNADARLRIAEALARYRRGPSMLAAE
jgi:alkylation response protein AidB-like acyl-CoA dehydrogenase